MCAKTLRPFKVQRPTFSEDYSVVLREGAGDLALRAEEVDTPNACINVDHIEENRWSPPLVVADWHAFCQAIYKGIEGEESEMMSLQRDEQGSRSQETK